MAISFDITLPDGRKLSYPTYGSTSTTAPVVFYHHGFPASHAEARLYDTAAQKHEIRLIAIHRPGMGNSTYQPNQQLMDWPADLLALADHLKVERFGILGTSGGGPYVLACCHSMPRSQCISAGIVSGLYPRSLGRAGMLFEARMMLYVAPWLTGLAAFGLDKGLGVIARDGEYPEKFDQALASNSKSRPPVDRELWNRDGDWGFPLEGRSAEAGKMFLRHGGADLNVPAHMAETAEKLMNAAEVRFLPDEGYASLAVNKSDEIVVALRGSLPT
ncbi:hypothetical protein SCAR479_12766 [Seiridium cardinale]|uniref:AB hydrolase-1 domain-containing protein n=1 Tax=Seiridium cardinale TaxID=138064 RepID=A0ABR2X9W5_9PEZI